MVGALVPRASTIMPAYGCESSPVLTFGITGGSSVANGRTRAPTSAGARTSSTGMGRGEILSLQWQQVRLTPRPELFLPGTKTKTATARRIPMSTLLRTIIERRRTDPAGEAISAEATSSATRSGAGAARSRPPGC